MQNPNIIFIMADDLGYGDIGCYNPDAKIPTPNIDKLSQEGMRFTDAHSPSAVCTPTRYSVLTGRYCWRTRLKKSVLSGYSLPLIEKDRLTIADMLKKEGYHTACIGKWHLGLKYKNESGKDIEPENPNVIQHKAQEAGIPKEIDFTQPVQGGPADCGFDYSYFTAACSTCNSPYAFIENKEFIKIPDQYYDDPMYTSRPGLMVEGWEHKDVDPTFTEKAVNYIKSRKDSEKPFFLYLTPSAPHEPCVESVVPEFARGKSKAGPRGDLVWLIDWVVGQIMNVLEITGQADNTLLVVTSDNGALPGDRVLDENEDKIYDENGEEYYHTYSHKSCGDWRGYKAHIWEGGHRIPFIIRFPGIITPGSISNKLVGLQDFYATISELIDRDLSKEEAEDSLSFFDIITGNESDLTGRNDLIHHSAFGVFSIRKGKWKLIIGTQGSGGWPPPRDKGLKSGTGQLYNMAEDPEESINLFDKYPEIVKRLKGLIDDYKAKDRSVQRI